MESVNPVSDYLVIRNELISYNKKLDDKKEIIVLTKSDTVSPEHHKEVTKLLSQKTKNKVFVVSILDNEYLKTFSDALVKLLK